MCTERQNVNAFGKNGVYRNGYSMPALSLFPTEMERQTDII